MGRKAFTGTQIWRINNVDSQTGGFTLLWLMLGKLNPSTAHQLVIFTTHCGGNAKAWCLLLTIDLLIRTETKWTTTDQMRPQQKHKMGRNEEKRKPQIPS